MKVLTPKVKKEAGETKQQTRHTHSVIAALEDAIALQWEIIDALADALLVAKSHAERTLEILKLTRKNPNDYDPNTGSRRIVIKKR